MSYQSVVAMAASQSLRARMVAAAAETGASQPLAWVDSNIWLLCSAAGWDEAWDYAVATTNPNVNPDTGIRNDVISDAMILASVQALQAEQATPAEPAEGA